MVILGWRRENHLGMRTRNWQARCGWHCLVRGLEDRVGELLHVGRDGRAAGACPDPGTQHGLEEMGNKHSMLFPAPLPNPLNTQTATGEQVQFLNEGAKRWWCSTLQLHGKSTWPSEAPSLPHHKCIPGSYSCVVHPHTSVTTRHYRVIWGL